MKKKVYRILLPTLLLTSSITVGLYHYLCRQATRRIPAPITTNPSSTTLPKPVYIPLNQDVPYTFEASTYAIVKKTNNKDQHCLTLHYPQFEATLYLTYLPIYNQPQTLHEYCDQAHRLSNTHHVKAESMEEQTLTLPNGNNAYCTSFKGPVASPFQFYTTDQKTHFLRGALYFQSPNQATTSIIDFLKADILHLLQTLQWR